MPVVWYLLVSHCLVPAQKDSLVHSCHSGVVVRWKDEASQASAGGKIWGLVGGIVIINCFFSLSKESFRERLGGYEAH